MRLFYLLLKPILTYAFLIYFPRRKNVNAPKSFFGSTIYVSNHAASFMDPLVIAALNNPIIFFLTRSDVFTKITKPFLWSVHMLPIYRQHDGEDTKKKNEAVFARCSRILAYGRNLLIFGEGFTDDVFIRRLKPVKKGAVRIGFSTLESINWKKKIYISAVGINYSDPNEMRSDILISYSDKICLNDYRDAYIENPNKVINELTKVVEGLMQEQLTHVKNKELAPFHENIMIINRKGMNAKSFNRSIPLLQRWKYSKKLADWLNEQKLSEGDSTSQLKSRLSAYFTDLNKKKLQQSDIHWKINSGSRLKEIASLILLAPMMILGLIHCLVPYLIAKRFTEKSFKRKVFWGSVKVILGMLIMGVLNIPVIFVIYHLIYAKWWVALLYYFSIGIFGLAAYVWFNRLKKFKAKGRIKRMNTSDIEKEYLELKKEIENLVPVK